MPKNKKKGNQQLVQTQTKKKESQSKKQNENQTQKSKQTQQIMNAITSMDLDNVDIIDVKGFQQSKSILVNALDQLELYIKYFQKGEYQKFPKCGHGNTNNTGVTA